MTSLFGYAAKLALDIDGTWIAVDDFVQRIDEPDSGQSLQVPVIDMSTVSHAINAHQAAQAAPSRPQPTDSTWVCDVCGGAADDMLIDGERVCADIACASHDRDRDDLEDEDGPRRKPTELLNDLLG